MLKKISTTLMALLVSTNIAFSAEFINILTGGTSGVYYPLGVGLSKIYGEKIMDQKFKYNLQKLRLKT